MTETKNSIFWTLVGTVIGATIVAIVFALAVASADDGVRRDSMGLPCSISTAQNADGTRECQ